MENEIEMFSLGLQYNLKSEKMKDSSNLPKQKVTAAVMDIKLRDEAQGITPEGDEEKEGDDEEMAGKDDIPKDLPIQTNDKETQNRSRDSKRDEQEEVPEQDKPPREEVWRNREGTTTRYEPPP